MLAKACGPRRFWLSSFVAANVLIDVEVLYFLRRNDPPIHRYLHTYLGGLAAGVAAGLLMFAVVRGLRQILPAGWHRPAEGSVRNRREFFESLAAGIVGGVSHVFLDSLMHRDMHPFWPFASGNALAGAIGIGTLHGVLGLSGFFGLVLWLLLQD